MRWVRGKVVDAMNEWQKDTGSTLCPERLKGCMVGDWQK